MPGPAFVVDVTALNPNLCFLRTTASVVAFLVSNLSESMDTANAPLCRVPRVCQWVLAWLGWLAFGFFFGFHWLVIYFTVAQSAADRRRALLHFVSYPVAFLVLGAGGVYVRTGVAVSCGNETGDMGRDCLWELQPLTFQVPYVLHFIGLAWLALAWIYDGVQLPGWLAQDPKRGPIRVCYSAKPLVAPWYPSVLCLGLVLLTLTWTCFVAWTINSQLTTLATVLLVCIIAVGLAGCVGLHAMGKASPEADVLPS